MFKSILKCSLSLVLLCAASVGVYGQSGEPSAPAGASDYVLMPSDLLQVKVFQEEELTREVSVSQNYTINLPLIGTIDVKSRTSRQTEELIRQLYDRDYLVNPQVNLIVIRYAERSVNVLGMVNNPGPVVFPQERGLTLVEAITRAGGFTRLAKRSQVQLTRTADDGSSQNYNIDFDKLIEGNSASSWTLHVGDVIYVPERVL